jgi:hypothetical protein
VAAPFGSALLRSAPSVQLFVCLSSACLSERCRLASGRRLTRWSVRSTRLGYRQTPVAVDLEQPPASALPGGNLTEPQRSARLRNLLAIAASDGPGCLHLLAPAMVQLKAQHGTGQWQ